MTEALTREEIVKLREIVEAVMSDRDPATNEYIMTDTEWALFEAMLSASSRLLDALESAWAENERLRSCSDCGGNQFQCIRCAVYGIPGLARQSEGPRVAPAHHLNWNICRDGGPHRYPMHSVDPVCELCLRRLR